MSGPVHSLRRVALLLVAGLCACAEDYTVTLVNETDVPLVPYVVVTDPPPPHRAADAAGTIPPGGQASIDPTGFNTIYYAEQPGFGLAIQLSLDATPAEVLVRSMRHQVPPGDEAGDPLKAPMVLLDQHFEPQSTNFALIVRRTLEGLPVALEDR